MRAVESFYVSVSLEDIHKRYLPPLWIGLGQSLDSLLGRCVIRCGRGGACRYVSTTQQFYLECGWPKMRIYIYIYKYK